MFPGQENCEKYINNCLKHGSSKVIYFCGDSECYESLCSACKSEHFNNHVKMNTDCLLLSFPMVLSETKDKLRNSIKRLNSFINSNRSTGESSNTSALSSNTSESTSSIENRGLEDLRKEYQDILKKLDGPDSLKILKIAYGKDYETELEDLKRKLLQKHRTLDLPSSNYKSGFEIRDSFGTKKTVHGLGSIVEELRDFGYRRGQPLQSGPEEDGPVVREEPVVKEVPTKRAIIRPQQLNMEKISEDRTIPEALKTLDRESSIQSITPIDVREISMISKISLHSQSVSPEFDSARLKALQVPVKLGLKHRGKGFHTPISFTRALHGTDEADTFDYHESEDNSQFSFDTSSQGSLQALSANSVQRDPNHDFLKTFRE